MARAGARGQNSTFSNVLMIIVGLVFFIFGLFMLIKGAGYIFSGKAVDLYEEICEDSFPSSGEYVTYEVCAVLGNYAETKHTINGFIPAGKEQHYAILLENGLITSITVKSKKMIEQLDTLTDATWDYFESDTAEYINVDPVVFTGKIVTLDSEVKKFLDEGLKGIGAEGYYDWNNLSIDATQTRAYVLFSNLGIILLGAVFILIGVTSQRKLKAEKNSAVGTASANQNSMNEAPFASASDTAASSEDSYTGEASDYTSANTEETSSSENVNPFEK